MNTKTQELINNKNVIKPSCYNYYSVTAAEDEQVENTLKKIRQDYVSDLFVYYDVFAYDGVEGQYLSLHMPAPTKEKAYANLMKKSNEDIYDAFCEYYGHVSSGGLEDNSITIMKVIGMVEFLGTSDCKFEYDFRDHELKRDGGGRLSGISTRKKTSRTLKKASTKTRSKKKSRRR